MKRSRDRPGILTRLCRMCYTSTFGILLLTVLTVYCNVSNETTVTGIINVTDTGHRFLTGNSWLRGFELCRDAHNLTMASADDIKDRTEILSQNGNRSTGQEYDWVQKYLPLWTYAFQVTDRKSGKILRITNNDVVLYKHAFKCSVPNGTIRFECCESIKDAEKQCTEEFGLQLHLPELEPTKITSFFQGIWTNTSRWVTLKDERDFLSGSEDFSVRCLLLDENGELRTDNCDSKHKTLCVGGNTQQVVRYVGNVTVPPYAPTTTKREPTGRSSTFTRSPSTPNKQDSNNTNPTAVNISSNSVPDKPGFWMDPQIRYSIIAVASLIVLAVLVAVGYCCCRRRNTSENKKRKSTHLADTYSETADSIAMKEPSVYETADTSEYAIPQDALKKARQRQSIGENEYDVISNSNKTKTKFTGNAYNHVTIVPSKDRRASSNEEENTYDVTNYGKQNAVVLTTNELTGNVYGEIPVKTDR